MDWKEEWKKLALIIVVFLACFHLPVGFPRFDNAISEALALVKWYAREHVLLCLVPAFFIAGGIAVFVNQASVMRYLGPKANKTLSYSVAAVSGTILAVCSCTVLPLFAGIYRMGAGLGPACAFLYSGPAISVLAIVLTARILGFELGVARAVCAIVFSVIIGLAMHFLFRRGEAERASAQIVLPVDSRIGRKLWQDSVFFAGMVGILVFANWGRPLESEGVWAAFYDVKWFLAAVFAAGLGVSLSLWFGFAWWKLAAVALPTAGVVLVIPDEPLIAFAVGAVALSIFISTDKGECADWFSASWGFAKQILPLLLIGVLVAGALLGRVGHEGLIPPEWISSAVGGESLSANFIAAFAGAFMYFATLTEVPIVQGLMANGMGKGPALALLLAGPALSLPSMLAINSVIGLKKTAAFALLVVFMSTFTGWGFGMFF